MDHIYLWEENDELIACILPDGENIYMSIRNGFEHLYPTLLSYSEEHCLPMFHKEEDGSVKFWVAANDSLAVAQKTIDGVVPESIKDTMQHHLENENDTSSNKK